jgi:cytochrome c55X
MDRPLLVPLLTHLAILLGATAVAVGTARASEPEPAQQRELVRLVRQDCGSCHGMSLQGGLGPALLPASLADKPADGLVATVLHGRPGTAMPGWSRFLSEPEAEWVVARLQAGFPPLALDGGAR